MKVFPIISVMAVTLLGLSNAQRCIPTCNRQSDPFCGETAECFVPAQNLCSLGYKACLLNLYRLSPIINVLPGFCPSTKPVCPGGISTYIQSGFYI